MLFRRGLPHLCSGIQTTSTSNLSHKLSFLLRRKKNKDLHWFDFHHITQFLCTECYDYSNAGNWQLHDKAAVAENTTPCWGSESKAITGSAVQDLESPFQVSVMLHNNLPLHPSNSKQRNSLREEIQYNIQIHPINSHHSKKLHRPYTHIGNSLGQVLFLSGSQLT